MAHWRHPHEVAIVSARSDRASSARRNGQIGSKQLFRLRCEYSYSGRGERGCPATNDLPVTMRLAEPPESCEWLRSA